MQAHCRGYSRVKGEAMNEDEEYKSGDPQDENPELIEGYTIDGN